MQVIKFEQKDSVGHIVLANPPKNLIASDFSNSLKQAVHEAGESDIRALLVRAEGPNFSQGGDVLDFLEKSSNQFRTFIAECNQSFRALEALQIPTVAAVRGVRFGGENTKMSPLIKLIILAPIMLFQHTPSSHSNE